MPIAQAGISWSGGCSELDLEVRVDQIGNILGIFPGQGAAKPIMIGSHIDTVSTGGRLDGAYGVIAGLEVIRTLKRHAHNAAPPSGRGVVYE